MAEVPNDAAAPRRRPSVGGYARGEETRARIVEAALKVFGAEGFERASTRQIAEAAGVKPPALQYYFNSKEGLHLACGEVVLAGAAPLFDVLRRAQARVVTGGREAAVAAVCDYLDTVVDLPMRVEPGTSQFMARMQADEAGPALALIQARLTRPMQEGVSALVGIALGRDADSVEVKLRTSLLLAQCTAIHTMRGQKTLDFLGWPDFKGSRGLEAKRVLRLHTKAILCAIDDEGTAL